MTHTSTARFVVALLPVLLLDSRASDAQTALAGDALRITRATGAFKIDSPLSDDGWVGVTPVSTWYEVNPGDNTPPQVRNLGGLAYDKLGRQFLVKVSYALQR